MPLATKRWCDPAEPGDGLRILVCRYRPRGLPKAKETWDAWYPELGPSPALHAAFYAKGVAPITLDTYRERYLAEMQGEKAQARIRELAERARQGPVTLLCSKACILPPACHRTLLRELIAQAQAGR
jgi:uncharacterized protein YeaO (DUF488 family)